ncbi:LuxR C-terminal-related transcriptional regulator [Sinorhizobium sp. A49]|uniref:LuxR C-terminal-related transcriptional regulator n=1 Tax=Sinorhizobium sp. A49 TaxID=1945861 RepID=UPI00098477C1|nr:LuxR C-terminal-related transcriptional regulator [Sinorhizobium sp. A49]
MPRSSGKAALVNGSNEHFHCVYPVHWPADHRDNGYVIAYVHPNPSRKQTIYRDGDRAFGLFPPNGNSPKGLSPRGIGCAETHRGRALNTLIGTEPTISENTVKGHVANILAKLRASDRTRAVTVGLKREMIEL